MKFSGWRKERKYTLCIEFNKVASILVEDCSKGSKTLYERDAKDVQLNKELFEETIHAVCRENMQLWKIVHNLLCKDNCYSQDLMQEIFARRAS